MEARYFSAPEQEACLQAAETYFATERGQLYCHFMLMEEGADALLLAIKPDERGLEPIENLDAFFTLRYLQEGVLLELFSSRGHGQPLQMEAFDSYLQRKRLSGLNPAAVKFLLNQGFGFIIIAPAQQELILNEEAMVTVDATESKADVTLLPGDTAGTRLDEEGLRQSLQLAGITHGLNEEALQQFLHEREFFKKHLVAEAIPPQRGKDGHLIFYFRKDFTGRPKEKDDGRVDYRALDLFENVKKGQLLATRVLPTAGVPGYTVKGREIPCSPGKDVRLPTGKNVITNDDHTMLRATASGMVVYAGNTLSISTVYQIKEADMTIGNIDFDGSVIISGNVIPGLTIKATGNIEVGGVVECSTLIAGGNIVLHRGSQGAGKGLIQADGNITANYIERATVLAGGSLTANIISYCAVEVGDAVKLTGKNGSLVGGTLRVSNSLKAQVIGTAVEMPTEVEVGLVPHKRERIRFLRQDLSRLQTEIEKLSTIVDYLDRNPSDDAKKISTRFTVGQSLEHNKQLFAEYTEELEELMEESESAIHGKVHVSDTAFPGVRLTIASASYKVTMPTEHCTFRVSGGEVVMGVYEG